MPEEEKVPEQAEEPIKEEIEEEQIEDPAMQSGDIMDVLGKMDNAPTEDQLAFWKSNNEVYSSFFSETEVYLWRPINWMEYKTVQTAAANNQNNPEYADEQVVSKCVLWPKITPDRIPTLKGGTIPTLSQQIMEGSNFVPPQVAMSLVVKL